MGLLYKSEKRALFKAFVLVILALAILGASIRYWYISLPLLALLAWLVVWLRRRHARAVSRARESVILQPSRPPVIDPVRALPASGLTPSTVADLAALADMRAKGVLSDQEFEAAKKRVLAT